MTTILKTGGIIVGASSAHDAMMALAQQNAQVICGTDGDTTDNSTGTPGAVTLPSVFVDVANDGGSLADKAETEAAMGKVKDAVAVLAEVGNALATKLGIMTLTDNTGGTVAASGTVAACDLTVAAAATGVQAIEMNIARSDINAALYSVANQARAIAAATGQSFPTLVGADDTSPATTLSAISTDGGTAADPGVSKDAVDAALASWTTVIANVAAAYNGTAFTSAKVIAG